MPRVNIKAVVPVAGIGTQLRPHTHTQPKPLIPVAGKPILGHILDALLEAGVEDVVLVVGYMREKIQQFVEKEYGDRLRFTFVIQEPRRGLAHAIWSAIPALQDADTLLINLGDTIFGEDVSRILELEGNILGVHPVEEPRKYGIAKCGQDGSISSLSEKPEIPTSNQALVGLYKITQTQELFAALEAVVSAQADLKANLSLTDALMRMIGMDVPFHPFQVENWFDCGSKESLLLAHHTLLGRVEDHPVYDFPGCVIIQPVRIAPNCVIKNSIIGPYVAVAENSTITNSVVFHSIIGAFSRLDTIILGQSVIGNDTNLKGKSHSINIGDNTEIDFDQ